ncbi:MULTISPECIES: ABC-type transport auxiliary lipoprotein family protein [Acidiphilium]|uniref:ABC-type transport auxiliary lipoprotein family protein n=1 Tax=Acidiphilium TaxID=522 RepID=UPI00257DC729|nr:MULTISPECIES: ABC-type transport auxiliary lipoprotein family protein [Acidiphilium]HQT84109.1 ABC-type transport auxiliary lipoprotein family protein [Acidiphilium rubrum]
MMSLDRRHFLLATPLALAGCGGILAKQPYVARSDWPLAPPPPVGPGVGGRGVVQVQGIAAGPTLSQRGLITLLADGSIHQGYYNRWATAPAQASTAALIAWLEASGAFAAVVGEGSSLTPDLIVEGTLDTLLADPAAHVARAALTLVVAKPVGIGERPLAQRRLRATAPLAGVTAPDLVAAQRAALAGVLGQAVALVRGLGAAGGADSH